VKIKHTFGRRSRSAQIAGSGNKHRRSAVLLAAAASTLLAMQSKADTYQLMQSGTIDWFSTFDSYTTWRDTTTSTNSNLPANGGIVDAYQSGTSGVNAIVNLNYAYSGTGLSTLNVDSGCKINQSSGTSAMIAGTVYIGSQLGGNGGTYTLAGGTLTSTYFYDGYGSSGYVNQSSGAASLSFLTVGYDVNGVSGTYTISGGTLAAPNFNDEVGTFNQSGGTVTISGIGYVGLNGTSTYNLSGGTFSSLGTNAFYIGDNGTGTFNVSNSAQVLMSSLQIGVQGTGQYVQTGGTVSVLANGTSGVFLGLYSPGLGAASGTVNGGTFSVPSGNLYVGYSGAATFSQGGHCQRQYYLDRLQQFQWCVQLFTATGHHKQYQYRLFRTDRLLRCRIIHAKRGYEQRICFERWLAI